MVPELEKPRITEIHARMDCKGCVEKLKKSLGCIKGVSNVNTDYPQQKITVIGRANLEKIVKAIKKSRKIATICSHTELKETEAYPPSENALESSQPPPPDYANPPPPNDQPPALPAEPAVIPPAELTKDTPPPPLENPRQKPEANPSSVATETNEEQSCPSSSGHDKYHVGEVHIIHHHPPDNYGYPSPNHYGYGYRYRGYWNRSYDHMNGQGYYSQELITPAQPTYVTQSYYNTYRPKLYVTEYHDHEYMRSPPQRTQYNRFDHYYEDHSNHVDDVNGNITSIFSDENPNACRVM